MGTDELTADLTAAEHLSEARRYARLGRQAEDEALGEAEDQVDAALDRAARHFSAANAHATSALAMLEADPPGLRQR